MSAAVVTMSSDCCSVQGVRQKLCAHHSAALHAPSLPVLAEGVLGREAFCGSETSHVNLSLAPIRQARKLIPLTQF